MLRHTLSYILIAECMIICTAAPAYLQNAAPVEPVNYDKTYRAVRAKRDIAIKTEIMGDDVEDCELPHNADKAALADNFCSNISAWYRNTKRPIKKGDLVKHSDLGFRTAPQSFPDPDNEVY